MKRVLTAGLVAAALGVAPAAVVAQETSGTAAQPEAQTEGTTTGTSGDAQTGEAQTGAQQQSSQMGSGGADQEAVRQHLAAARQSLAELTQLPAAGQLDGDQRQQVSQFISHFNEFATATTDWRDKYENVDESLDQILDSADAPGAAGAAPASSADAASPDTAAGETAAATTSPDAAAGETAAATTAGGFDPTIISKLRETREHLDAFELATGDPGFVADRIAQILDNAASGSGDAAVGTSGAGTTAGQSDQVQGSGVSATGMVTLSQSQVEDIRRHLERLRRR